MPPIAVARPVDIKRVKAALRWPELQGRTVDAYRASVTRAVKHGLLERMGRGTLTGVDLATLRMIRTTMCAEHFWPQSSFSIKISITIPNP